MIRSGEPSGDDERWRRLRRLDFQLSTSKYITHVDIVSHFHVDPQNVLMHKRKYYCVNDTILQKGKKNTNLNYDRQDYTKVLHPEPA